MTTPSLFAIAPFFAIAISLAGAVRAEDDERFFEQQVRPLLVKKCLECHGEKKQESSLRLDSRASLLKGGVSGAAVDLASPQESLLLKAIRHEGELHMPPKDKLAAAEIDILTRWVARGIPMPKAAADSAVRSGEITAQERKHWAFQPVRSPPVPTVQDAAWPLNDIDCFVLDKLEQAGLRPAAAADKRSLIRRATLDLTGLPPTYDEVQEFLADDSPQAYERLIERLLSSAQYGERWGRHWLDLARYADTAGDGADYPIREAYKYRNYVINALNADLPYDQFLREQIAGDILAKQNVGQSTERFAEQVIATGYLAMTKRFGYSLSTDFQHLDIADTLDVLGRSVLGLSLGCARCHDHKYEPITAEDYYALYGIFASSQYSFPGGEEHKRPHHLVPLVPPAELAERQSKQQAELAACDQRLKELDQRRTALLDSLKFAGGIDFGFEEQEADKPPAAPWFTAGPNKVVAEAQSPFDNVHPAGTRGLRIAEGGKPNDGIRQQVPALSAEKTPRLYFNLDFRTASTDKAGTYRLFLGHGAIVSTAVECSIAADSLAIRNGADYQRICGLEPATWYNLQLDLDLATKKVSGRVGQMGKYTDFTDLAFVPNWDGVIDTFFSDNLGEKPGAALSRDLDNLALQSGPLQKPAAGDAIAARASRADARKQLAELDKDIGQTKQRREQASATTWEVAYGVSEAAPMNVRLQKRGEPDRLGDEVPRRFLEILGGDLLPKDSAGSGRWQLAEWITRPTNPLTARVMVNRVWQQHFGRGLVATPSDFGIRGERPTHPELLDYLASRFIAEGWSLKKLHRWMMLSRTYQMVSDEPSENTIDPGNTLFGRQRRRPLDAEAIRDAMLAASGRLDRAQPGGHPFPPVAQWGYTIHYPFQAVYDSRHRSVYLMVQRAQRHPFLALFDGSDPNISTAVRDTTITPTQALYLMNSPFVHEQAAGLAERVLSEAEDAQRLEIAYRSVLARSPTSDESMDATQFLQAYRDRLAAQQGGAPPDTGAWSALIRVLLTSNEFLYVD